MSTEMRDVKLVSVVEDDKGLQSPDSNGDTPTTVSDIPANEKPAKSMDKGDDIRVEIQDDVTIKSDVEAAAAPPPLEYDIPAGWWIVFAGFATLFLAGGIHYSWGTFIRAYYYSNYFGSQTSYFTISFIGSLNNMALTGGALIVSPFLAHYGPQIIIFASTILQGIALILASFSTAAWATLLTQGLLFGIGEIGVYLAVVHIVQQYFLKKKGLALGLAVSGSGFGGLCMSSVSQILIDKTGFAWSLRILAFMILGVGLGAGLLMRPRVTPAYKKAKAGEKIKRPPVFVWKAFKNPYFTVLFISSGISIFGYFVPFIILPSYAYSVGISTSLASLSLGVLNGASAIGRIAIGILGDKIGYVNSFLVVQFGCPIIVLVLWPFAKSLGLVMLTAALYGFFAGGMISIIPAVSMTLFGPTDAVATLALQMSSGIVATLAGPPISGIITDKNTTILPDGTKSIYWLPSLMYAGGIMLAGALPLLWIRGSKTNWKFLARI